MSLLNKRAKIVLSLSEVERALGLPEGIQISRVVSHDDPPGLTVHIVSGGFTEVIRDVEAPILTVRALFSEDVNKVQASKAEY